MLRETLAGMQGGKHLSNLVFGILTKVPEDELNARTIEESAFPTPSIKFTFRVRLYFNEEIRLLLSLSG